MIIRMNENIFDNKMADAIVNAVNTEGVMNRGIALEFKKRYPAMFQEYKEKCSTGDLCIGRVHVYEGNPIIINFPTKELWRDPSQISYIKIGLEALKHAILNYDINSIAIPALGCGLGLLDWSEVKPIIEDYFNNYLPDIEVYLYEPHEHLKR